MSSSKRNSDRKRKGIGSGVLLLAVLLVIIAVAGAAGLYYASGKSKPKDISEGTEQSFDLMEESKTAHRTLDDILLEKSAVWQLQDSGREEEREELPRSRNVVTWTKRSVDVGVPVSTDLAGAAQWMKEKMEGPDLKVVSEGESKKGRYDAWKVEVGIQVLEGKDKDGKERTRLFVTDTVRFFHNSNLSGRDKDVKALTETEKKELTEDKKHHGKLAVVIDDCGYNNAALRTLLGTDLPFTYAIIPYKPGSSEALSLIRKAGKTPILHLPMEPMNAAGMSEEKAHTVMVGSSTSEMKKVVTDALDSLPGVEGCNNHQGSRATSDPKTMKTVLGVLKSRGLFFFDSRTSSKTVGMETALSMGVPTAKNTLFLDNEASESAIYNMIQQAMDRADANGSAIVICHARPVTAATWKKYKERIEASGIQLVPLTSLLQ